MARKKEQFYLVEFPEEDSLHKQYNPIFNFLSTKDNLEKAFLSFDKHNLFKEDLQAKKKIETIIKSPENNEVSFVGNNTVFIEEIKPPQKLKSYNGYIYRLNDYNENKAVLGTFNEVISYIKKKIKNKYSFFSYNGVNETIEFSEKAVSDIIARMTAGTHVVRIAQVGGKGDINGLILITPFKIFNEE